MDILISSVIIILLIIFVFKRKNKGETKPQVPRNKELNHDDFGIKEFKDSGVRKVENQDIELKLAKGGRKPQTQSQPTSGGGKKTTTTTTTLKQDAVIYLDFTGGLVTGTSWNYNGDIPYNHSGLSLDEQRMIFDSMYEDYSIFNVVLTTDINVYNAANPFKRTRAIFTTSWEWYGQAGGVSYTGSFTWGDNTPCWIFTSLLNYNNKYIREAGSHEVGHTIGLRHQSSYDENCVKVSEYNYGNDLEAPIMGVAYYAAVGKWWVGPGPYGCNTIQDDIQIINSVI